VVNSGEQPIDKHLPVKKHAQRPGLVEIWILPLHLTINILIVLEAENAGELGEQTVETDGGPLVEDDLPGESAEEGP